MGADPAIADAVYVMDRIVAKESVSISQRDLFELTKGRFKKVTNLIPALVILQEHEYLRQRDQTVRTGPGRRPSPVFEVNPFTSSQYSHKSHNS
jgi:replicative DNA helicase